MVGSGERVPARDFRPAVGDLTRTGSWFETARRNLDLIDLARRIESEGRPATPEEQAQLARYVGFGASEIRNAMFPVPSKWHKDANPDALIFPEAVFEARWKPLAERAAAIGVERYVLDDDARRKLREVLAAAPRTTIARAASALRISTPGKRPTSVRT